MESYRPLRLVFFIYDFARLVVMTGLLVRFAQPESSQGVFPYVFYAVPNSLFPLMSFFLWVNPGAYRPFIALYMAGKILAVVSVLAWLIFSLPGISASFLEAGRLTFIVAGTALLLSAGDALSVLGGAIARKHILNAALPQEPGRPLGQGSVNLGAAEVPEEGN
ncbi:MAG: hypothetical protein LBG14_00430 [Treponema sp.]|jgi:hypothetical protein|nr:hypothetical protein [Treponema sp.]